MNEQKLGKDNVFAIAEEITEQRTNLKLPMDNWKICTHAVLRGADTQTFVQRAMNI